MGDWLFQHRPGVKLHSGGETNFLINCTALTHADWADLARIASAITQFGRVIGIPRGGLAFASAMKQYLQPECSRLLIVDDVMTTGGSFEETRKKVDGPVHGICVFARGAPQLAHPDWVTPLFTTTPDMETAIRKART